MSDRIYADLAVLERGVIEFERVLGAYQETLSELDDRLSATLAQWEGTAEQAYRAVHDEWREQTHDLAERLVWLRQVIATAHGNYRNSLSTNRTMWST